MCLTSEEKRLLNRIPAMTIVTDIEGNILFVNQKLEKELKIEIDKNDNIFHFLYGELKEKGKEDFQNFINEGHSIPTIVQVLLPAGKKTFSISSEWLDDDKKTIIHSVEDITQLKETEKILEKNHKLIKSINRILRHDLANSFSVIISAIRLFRKIDEFSKKEEIIKEMEKECRKAFSTLNRLKEVETVINKQKQLEIYNLQEIVDQLIYRFNILIEVKGEGQVLADQVLHNMFENIINNAIQHGQAGKIMFNIENRKNNTTIVEIQNNGNKIEELILPQIFEEGIKGEKTGNTGVGLYIVKENMERYGGKVFIKDNEDGNVCFVLEFNRL